MIFCREKPQSQETLEMLNGKREGGRDEVPDDIHAFFGHPLSSDGIVGEDTDHSALAILHEYQSLPAIDRTDTKVGDKLDSLADLLK